MIRARVQTSTSVTTEAWCGAPCCRAQGAALRGRGGGGGGQGRKWGLYTDQSGLTAAQHLCSTLVSLVNPGLVGISLEEKKVEGGGVDEWVGG